MGRLNLTENRFSRSWFLRSLKHFVFTYLFSCIFPTFICSNLNWKLIFCGCFKYLCIDCHECIFLQQYVVKFPIEFPDSCWCLTGLLTLISTVGFSWSRSIMYFTIFFTFAETSHFRGNWDFSHHRVTNCLLQFSLRDCYSSRR